MKQTRQSPTTTDPFRITLFFETILYFHEEVNNMKKLLLAAVLCAALVLVSAAGCIGSDPIVGTWETKPCREELTNFPMTERPCQVWQELLY